MDRVVAITRTHYGSPAGQATMQVVLPMLVASMRAVGKSFRARFDYGVRFNHQALPSAVVLGAADDSLAAALLAGAEVEPVVADVVIRPATRVVVGVPAIAPAGAVAVPFARDRGT